MTFNITHQEQYSRGELLLRTIFGAIYIAIPHAFLLVFLALWSAILMFVTFWAILFTGNYPEGFFNYQLRFLRWNYRLNASLPGNLVDSYPPFGLDAEWDKIELNIDRPEQVGRGSLLLRAIFGAIYVGIPHGIALAFREIGTLVLSFLAWWVVLFTGNYPEKWHAFNVGTLRWQLKVTLYLGWMTDEYPSFTGKAE